MPLLPVLPASSHRFRRPPIPHRLTARSRLTSAALPTAHRGCCCGRRHLLGASAGGLLLPLPTSPPSSAAPPADAAAMLEKVHPARPDWYEELYARALDQGMQSYEAEVAGFKAKLFSQLTGANRNILELGVGTGPNLKYYASANGVNVIGVDPNKHMEEYARAAAAAAGLPLANFTFKRGVGEALPAEDSSMDAVIGTLVLCSVGNINLVLREIKRVLKPGGLYLFIEHVAAQDGSLLQYAQRILDPVQQWVSDGCHLTRKTGEQIGEAGFSRVSLDMARLSSVYIISPHVYGVARK